MKVIDLFSGIGGFSLGLERAGHETIAFCEIDPYCQKVLKKHWPKVPIYDDIKTFSNAECLRQLQSQGSQQDKWGWLSDICITAGFPCQDISCAGKRQGIEGERSGLWSELARILGELRPRYAILENVSALLSGDRGRWFSRVIGDLAEIGYDCEWHCIPASYLGAPHRRDRIWIVAYPNSKRWSGEIKPRLTKFNRTSESTQHCIGEGQTTDEPQFIRDPNIDNPDWGTRKVISDTPCQLLDGPGIAGAIRRTQLADSSWWQSEPDVGRVAHGVPARMDRLRCLGNAIVPQMAEVIGRAINETP